MIASVTGKDSHTPVIPSKVDSANTTGIITTNPRMIESVNAGIGRFTAPNKDALMMFIPTNINAVK